MQAIRSIERDRAPDDVEDEATPRAPRFWLTSAGRLIAGMMYLGQWEERCETLVAELAGIGGILCVEDLLDLARTGGSAASNSLAAFFVPYLQRGELRMIAEATPAELEAARAGTGRPAWRLDARAGTVERLSDSPLTLDAIAKGGNFEASMAQDFKGIGRTTADAVKRTLAGEKIKQSVIYVPTKLITAANVKE